MKIPATLWNLLEKLGRKPENMVWSNPFDYLAATDLTPEQARQMRETVESLRGKLAPISGYVYTIPNKGEYFIPNHSSGMIMKIEAKATNNDNTENP